MSRIKRCGSRRLPGRGDRVLGLLPERAHRSLDALSELRAIFDGLHELAGNPTKPVTMDDIGQTRRHVRELTKVGEREIHEVVLLYARPAPTIELRADYETNPPLTAIAGEGRSLPDGFPTS
jgi:hypothetical protein